MLGQFFSTLGGLIGKEYFGNGILSTIARFAGKALGDYLIVALNTDSSVSRLKGPSRPVNTLADRMTVVAALRCVDCVVSFDEDTPERIIGEIKPDIHVKGGDYNVESLPESKIVHSYGGQVVIVPLLEGRSSSNVIDKLNQE